MKLKRQSALRSWVGVCVSIIRSRNMEAEEEWKSSLLDKTVSCKQNGRSGKTGSVGTFVWGKISRLLLCQCCIHCGEELFWDIFWLYVTFNYFTLHNTVVSLNTFESYTCCWFEMIQGKCTGGSMMFIVTLQDSKLSLNWFSHKCGKCIFQCVPLVLKMNDHKKTSFLLWGVFLSAAIGRNLQNLLKSQNTLQTQSITHSECAGRFDPQG